VIGILFYLNPAIRRAWRLPHALQMKRGSRSESRTAFEPSVGAAIGRGIAGNDYAMPATRELKPLAAMSDSRTSAKAMLVALPQPGRGFFMPRSFRFNFL
jgi:hypothetical protein